MKKIFCALIFILSGSLPVFAQDGDQGFYTRFDLGYAYSTLPGIEKGYAVQTGFGQRWGRFVRGEFTLEFSRNRLKGISDLDPPDGSVRSRLPSLSAMFSGYVDLFDYKGISPYIGAGIGVARNDMPDFVVNGQQFYGDLNYRLAWKAMAGIGIDLPANLVLDIGYAYNDLGRFSARSLYSAPLQQEAKIRKIYVGLRYDF